MCREEKSISSYVKTRLRNTCLIVFKKKNTEAATGGSEAAIGGVLLEKMLLNILQTSQDNSCVGASFYEVGGIQPASFLKIDSNTMLFCEVCKTYNDTYFEEYLQTTVSGRVL